MITEIKNHNVLILMEQLLLELNTLIDLSYSILEKTTLEEDIIKQQNLIDIAKQKHLGIFGLIQIYKATLQNKKNKGTYEVREGDNLVLISQAFYGKPNYWQYIYEFNALDTDELTIGQTIIIPELPKKPEPVLFSNDI